jgi:hypothetical protein
VPRRHDDHGQVHRARDVHDPRVRLQPVDLAGLGVHGRDRPGEAGLLQVAEDLRPDSSGLTVGADDRDDLRLEERPHRGKRRLLRALGRARREERRRFERQRDVEHAALQFLRYLEARFDEDLEHPAILPEHVRVERTQIAAASDFGEPFEHASADALALHRVADRERHLGPFGPPIVHVIAREAGQPPTAFADQHELPVAIDACELPHFLEVEAGHGHEPVVEAEF